MNERIPQKFREDEEIVRQTLEQLKKDFGSQLPEVRLSGQKNLLFEELTTQLADVLENLKKTNPQLLRTILYRVDVSEREYSATKGLGSLAETIIQREFKKVLTRHYFSSGKK